VLAADGHHRRADVDDHHVAGDVLVELAASGLCHSDEHARYPLEQINEGYQAMRDGTNIRGVITFR